MQSSTNNKTKVIKIDSDMNVDLDGDKITINIVDENGKPIVGKKILLKTLTVEF
ncbi:hypothetical protein ALNOE001_13030 [Candidatus Methanobinarius endosymbioticus]|uniref:Uncharacterized protein n=1 Tax=Candidatus Methanobinarius endosymbioticus TaxID=2006182 RepID=A0A366MA00_9EURY|nr:hypothetical protein ALNOE001_13030 [Candidatus Methanobinarius endosymbioticus]